MAHHLPSDSNIVPGEIVSANRGTFPSTIEANEHGMSFIGDNMDHIVASGLKPILSITNGLYDTIDDKATAFYLTLSSVQQVTINDFQLDPRGHVDLYGTGYHSTAQAFAALQVTASGATYLPTTTPGRPSSIVAFAGDMHVTQNQITVHS